MGRLKIAAAAVARHGDIIGPTQFPFSVYIYSLWYNNIYTVYAYTPVEGTFYFGANLRRSIGLCRTVAVNFMKRIFFLKYFVRVKYKRIQELLIIFNSLYSYSITAREKC